MATVLITGSNRGIGLEFVKQYLHAGWRVMACCRRPEAAVELGLIKNDRLEIIGLDVDDIASIKQLKNNISRRPIDILINNAGVAGTDATIKEVSQGTLLSTFQTNTIGPTLVVQHLLASLELGTRRTIANISSYYGSIEENNYSDYFAYSVSKSALNAATKCMANALKTAGMIVISIDPGWAKTDMGGAEAYLSSEQSVKGMRTVLEKINLSSSGKFFRHDGSVVPW